MRDWLLFLHIGAVLGFMLAHGVQVTVMLRQRGERDPRRTLAMFESLPDVFLLRLLGGAMVVTGFALVVSLSLWGRWWIWMSLVLLIGIWILMYRYGGAYYGLIETAATRAIEARDTDQELEAERAFGAARSALHPIGLTMVGVAGLAVILWLMVFKPF